MHYLKVNYCEFLNLPLLSKCFYERCKAMTTLKMFSIMIILIISATICFSANTSEFQRSFGSRDGDSDWNSRDDLNRDGIIDGQDLALASQDLATLQPDQYLPLYKRDHVLVKFTETISQDDVNAFLKPLDSITEDKNIDEMAGYHRVKVPMDDTVETFLAKLKQDPRVLDASPNFLCRKSGTPNDELFKYQWNFKLIRSEIAWDLTGGGDKDVIVAVLDTGIAYENYDDYIRAPDFAETSFVKGYDFINSDDHANDDEQHGTHVAGTIAESTDNKIGAAGLAFRCSLMPVKILDDQGVGTSDTLSQGIRWAVDHGADVINMSLGFPLGATGGDIVLNAIKYAASRDVICVGSAGNDAGSSAYSGGIEYPAAAPECVSVGAIRYDKNRTYYSNWGNGLTCVAPGGDLSVDQNHDGRADGILQQTFKKNDPKDMKYISLQGTSQAAPHVSAAAALFKSRHGGGRDAFVTALQQTCTDLGSVGYDPEYGYGLIDLYNLIRKTHGWGANGW
jgi:serine protease